MIRISQILKDKGDRVVTIEPDATIAEVVAVLQRERIGAVVVMQEKEELVGVISIGDVVKNRLEELETETTMLQEYITGRR